MPVATLAPNTMRLSPESLSLSLTPGLLYPGPSRPEDLCVEGEECQRPGEEGGHEPGTGKEGLEAARGGQVDVARA